MAERKQFDKFLGGTQSLPPEVPIMKVVAARASEISAITHSLENARNTKLIFQRLPIYMRRRVMSHNVKRLPRRLRKAHLSQMTKSGLPPKSKRPSRKFRRRPTNILSAYSRRQQNNTWLETHIWHAKRFHMMNKWGYRIASHPNDRCFRANYRAVTEHCLLQDISYYICVEICGNTDVLKDTLKMHCLLQSQLSFSAVKYITGRCEGTVTFYKRSNQRCPIGNVHFLWRPEEPNLNTKTIWIWVHPSIYVHFLDEIISSFEFKEITFDENAADAADSSIPLYTNNTDCKMRILRNELNRFRLYGPLAFNTLIEALQVPSNVSNPYLKKNCTAKAEGNSLTSKKLETRKALIGNTVPQSSEDETEQFNTEDLNTTWHIEYYKRNDFIKFYEMQAQLWQELKISGAPDYLPRSIIGLTVLDPRFYSPEKRKKPERNISGILLPILSDKIKRSAIWDIQIRRIVSSSCASTSKINQLRSECLVPGVVNDKYYDENVMAKIPILLIPRYGNRETGIDAGIDIILPAGWAMPFWLALVQRCVKVGALRDSRSIAFESLNADTPEINDPDNSAYMKEALSRRKELIDKYFRYPPNRRINFTKVGISSPFFCDWENLIKDWSGITGDFYILRERVFLQNLQAAIHFQSSTNSKNNNMECSSTENICLDIQNSDVQNCLVRVKVSMIRKGSPKEFAIICVPTSEDLEKFVSNKKWSGPVERRHTDPNKAVRKVSRRNHLMLLKRLKRQRIRRKMALKRNPLELLKKSTDVKDNASSSILSRREIIMKQSEAMSKLYLPNSTIVRHSCDREVMGYVTVGHFSYSQAKGIGIGYIALPSISKLITQKMDIVLVRNTQTRQYRLAKLSIFDV